MLMACAMRSTMPLMRLMVLVVYVSNHDVPRSATRQLTALGLGPDQSDAMQLCYRNWKHV